jgi:hypothetical protein
MIYFGIFIAGYLGAFLASFLVLPIVIAFMAPPRFIAFFASGFVSTCAMGIGIGLFRLTDNKLNVFVLIAAMAAFFANELWQKFVGSARNIGTFRLAGSVFAFAAMYLTFL